MDWMAQQEQITEAKRKHYKAQAEITEFHKQQREFYYAAQNLLEAWENSDNEYVNGDKFCTGYPFDRSFDEVVSRINNWLHEGPEPESKEQN